MMRIVKVLGLLLTCVPCGFLCRAQENFLEFPGGVRSLYWSAKPLETGDKDAEYAVIFVHGLQARTKDLTPVMKALVRKHPQAGKVLFVLPAFPTAKSCPPEHRGKIAEWDLQQHDWRNGDTSSGEHGVSSYAVIDRIYELLSDRGRYPALKHILLCGVSAGGQVVNRYVAVGRFVRKEHLSYAFAVGAPSTYLYLDGRRPAADGSFRAPEPEVPDCDVWHLGLSRRNAYAAAVEPAGIMANFLVRPTLYLCGDQDVGKRGLASSPGAMAQGANRYLRFQNYRKYVALFPEWEKRSRFVTVPGAGHSLRKVLDVPEFISLIFGGRE